MILGINACGMAEFSTAIPDKRIHNQAKFYGLANIDNVHIQNIHSTQSDVENIFVNTVNQERNINTLLLANFNNSLEAGEFDNAGTIVTHWRIYRRKVGESIYTFLTEIPYVADGVDFYDYTAQNGVQYEYEVKATSSGIEGNGKTGVGSLDFFGWILSDEDEDIVYKFDAEIESGDINVLRDITLYDNYSEKPAFRFGKRNYRQGNLKTMPLMFNVEKHEYEITLDTLESLRDFINKPNIKILKNAKGEIFRCITKDMSYKYIDKVREQPYTVSFDFTEVK